MKVYGFDDVGVARGEMIAAMLPGRDLKLLSADLLAEELGWEYLDKSFVVAKHELIRRMEASGASEELVETVRSLKEHYIPVKTEIS